MSVGRPCAFTGLFGAGKLFWPFQQSGNKVWATSPSEKVSSASR